MVDNSIKKKKFNIYYKDSSQVIKLYDGTKQDEIISTLYKLLNIENSKILYFYDEDGDQLVISSAMPDDIKIFVKDEYIIKDSKIDLKSDIKEEIETDKSISVEKTLINEKEWAWVQCNNVIFNDKYTFVTNSENKTILFGDTTFTSGVHYWRFKISKLICCHDFGITNSTNPNNFKASYWNESLENINQIGLPMTLEGELADSVYSSKITGPGYTSLSSANLNDMYYGCYLDMNKKFFCIFNETKEKLYKFSKLNKIENATPYYFANKHDETITLNIINPPEFVVKYVENLKL